MRDPLCPLVIAGPVSTRLRRERREPPTAIAYTSRVTAASVPPMLAMPSPHRHTHASSLLSQLGAPPGYVRCGVAMRASRARPGGACTTDLHQIMHQICTPRETSTANTGCKACARATNDHHGHRRALVSVHSPPWRSASPRGSAGYSRILPGVRCSLRSAACNLGPAPCIGEARPVSCGLQPLQPAPCIGEASGLQPVGTSGRKQGAGCRPQDADLASPPRCKPSTHATTWNTIT